MVELEERDLITIHYSSAGVASHGIKHIISQPWRYFSHPRIVGVILYGRR